MRLGKWESGSETKALIGRETHGVPPLDFVRSWNFVYIRDGVVHKDLYSATKHVEQRNAGLKDTF